MSPIPSKFDSLFNLLNNWSFSLIIDGDKVSPPSNARF